MSIEQMAWGSAELLEQNRRRRLKELRREIQQYEARYELSSDLLEKELEAGRLRETAEVCNWLIALETYQALDHEPKA